MSQYPYQPPQDARYGYGYPGQDPMAVLLAPAKRASIFMFVLAGLMIPCGILFGFLSVAIHKVDMSQLPAESQQQFKIVEQQFAKAGMTLAGGLQMFAAFIVIPGIILLVLGVLVRRGGMGSAIASLILCCLMALVVGFQALGALLSGQPQAVGGACVFGLVLALLVAAIVSLFGAAKNAGQVSQMRLHYQSQAAQGGGAPYYPSQAPQNWQQPGGQWGGPPAWPPQPPPPPPPQSWPPPPPPPANP